MKILDIATSSTERLLVEYALCDTKLIATYAVVLFVYLSKVVYDQCQQVSISALSRLCQW